MLPSAVLSSRALAASSGPVPQKPQSAGAADASPQVQALGNQRDLRNSEAAECPATPQNCGVANIPPIAVQHGERPANPGLGTVFILGAGFRPKGVEVRARRISGSGNDRGLRAGDPDHGCRAAPHRQVRPCRPQKAGLDEAVTDRLRRNLTVSPLERAGIREDAECIVDAIIAHYVTTSDADRERIRALFRTYDSFRWAVGWGLLSPAEPINAGQLRKALLLFSIKDQGADWRDAIVTLDRICALALRTSLPLAETLTEVAGLSSDEARFQKFKMSRSTRALLLDYSRRMEPA